MSSVWAGRVPSASSKSFFLSVFPGISSQTDKGIRLWRLQHTREISTTKVIDAKFSANKPPSSPMAVLPTKSLIRSLVINYVCSKPWLLNPSIFFLSALCQPHRFFLFNVERNKLLAWLLKGMVYKHFCAGETTTEVRNTMKEMKALGFRGVIITYARETLFDQRTKKTHGLGVASEVGEANTKCPGIEAWRQGSLESAYMLEEGDQLALKLTGAGPHVTDAFARGDLPPQQMLDALDATSEACKQRKVRIIIDAESQHYQSGIARVAIELMRKHNRDGHAVVYNTYQAYLKSTPDTIYEHLDAASKEGFTLGLKLVRGAYLDTEKRSLIHDTKKDTDNAYNAIAQGALKQVLGRFGAPGGPQFPPVELLLAGHNMESVMAAHKLHQQRVADGLPTVPVAFAQLQGMSDRVSFQLLNHQREKGNEPDVYKCSTWGSLAECLGYLARRAAENRDAASRTVEECAALKTEAMRRLKLVFWPSAQK